MGSFINPNAIVLLLRFVQNRPTYLEDFENGDLYFSSLQSFIDLDLNNNNSKTGDKNEGNIHETIKALRYFHISDSFIPVRGIKSLTVDYSLSEYQKRNLGICSFFAVQFKDLIKKDSFSNEYRLKNNILKDLYRTKDGDRVLFGVNNVQAVELECRKKNLEYGLVNYYDSDRINKIDKLRNHKEFCKVSRYRFQHEFRIVKNISNGNNLKHLESVKSENFKSNILGDLNVRKNNQIC